jgi:hypothetical protein
MGPLPLGVWLGVGAVGLGVGYMINKRMAASSAAATPADSSTQLAETGVGTGGGQFVYTPPTDTTGPELTETNSSWGTKVTNWLISQGQNPTAADQAVRKYLSAQSLTLAEDLMIKSALLKFGVPPEPLPPTDDDGGIPTPNTVVPKAVASLHVNRATGRNEVVWDDVNNDDADVTFYKVMATNLANGKYIATSVLEVPGTNTMSWTHTASPTQGAQQLTYRYTVTPFNGLIAGAPTSVDAVMSV